MLSKIKKSNSEGFTIIEVMIVLAVAALILLIVLLAVPALQRTSRNTALKNDASTVSGAVSTFIADNNGTIPQCVATTSSGAGTVYVSSTAAECTTGYYNSPSPPGGTDEKVTVQGSTLVATNTGLGTVGSAGSLPTIGTSTGDITTGQIIVAPSDSCPSGGTIVSTRTVAVFYINETSGTPSSSNIQCIEAS